MGVRIDRLVLLSLLAGTLYLFFVGAFHSVPLAAASAFLALALLRKIAGRFPTLRRGTPGPGGWRPFLSCPGRKRKRPWSGRWTGPIRGSEGMRAWR